MVSKYKISGKIKVLDEFGVDASGGHAGVLVLIVGEAGRGASADITRSDGSYEFEIEGRTPRHIWFAPTHVQIKDTKPVYFALTTPSSVRAPTSAGTVDDTIYLQVAASGPVAPGTRQSEVQREIEAALVQLKKWRDRVEPDLQLPRRKQAAQALIDQLDDTKRKLNKLLEAVKAGGLTDSQLDAISRDVAAMLADSKRLVDIYFSPTPVR